MPLTSDLADIIADAIGPHLRREDEAECNALGSTGRAAVKESISISILSYGAFEKGNCVAAWGFTAASLFGDVAHPWLLTTAAVDRNKKTFLKANKAFIEFLNGEYPILETWVHSEYTKALRWLRCLGFFIEPAAPFGPLQTQFCRVVRGAAY